jgi:O-antigen ligase
MGRDFRPPRAAVLFVAPAFLVWGLLSLLAVERLNLGIGKLTTIAQLLVLVFATASVVRTRRDAERLAWVLLITTVISVQYGIVRYRAGASENVEGLSASRNSLGLFIAMCVPLVVYFYYRSRLPVRIGLIVVGFLLLVGEVLSYSRGGFILFLTALILSFVLLAKGSRLRLGLQLAALVMASFYVVPNTYLARVRTIVPSIEAGTDTMGLRYQLWGISVRMIRDHPILGVGPGNYLHQFMRYGGTIGLRRAPLVAHNSYLSVSVEMGLVGGALFAGIILVSVLTFVSVRRRALACGEVGLAHLASSFAISLVLFAICGAKGSLEDFKYLWMLFGLSAAMVGVVARHESATSPLPSSPQ